MSSNPLKKTPLGFVLQCQAIRSVYRELYTFPINNALLRITRNV